MRGLDRGTRGRAIAAWLAGGAVALGLLAIGGCGDDDDEVPASTVDVDRLATTTNASDVVYSVAGHRLVPDPLPGSDGAKGSGCVAADVLPDGIWYGTIRGFGATEVEFDLACLRWIEDPNDDTIEEGGWEIANTNPRLRVVPVHPEAEVMLAQSGSPQIPYTEWTDMGPGGQGGVWLYINGGVITEIAEAQLAG